MSQIAQHRIGSPDAFDGDDAIGSCHHTLPDIEAAKVADQRRGSRDGAGIGIGGSCAGQCPMRRQKAGRNVARPEHRQPLSLEEPDHPAQNAVVTAAGERKDRREVAHEAPVDTEPEQARALHGTRDDDLAHAGALEAREHATELTQADPLVRVVADGLAREALDGDDVNATALAGTGLRHLDRQWSRARENAERSLRKASLRTRVGLIQRVASERVVPRLDDSPSGPSRQNRLIARNLCRLWRDIGATSDINCLVWR